MSSCADKLTVLRLTLHHGMQVAKLNKVIEIAMKGEVTDPTE